MKAHELRLGNYYEYRVIDQVANTDTWELTTIDIDDLKWLLKNPDYSMYRPIEITDEWLNKIGAIGVGGYECYIPAGTNENGKVHYSLALQKKLITKTFYVSNFKSQLQKKIKYLHELQNLNFALTGQELTLNIEEK